MEQIENIDNIAKVFSASDISDMRDAMKKIIVDQFESDMRDLEEYLIHPEHIRDMIKDLYDEVLEEIKGDLKKRLYAKMLKDSGLE